MTNQNSFEELFLKERRKTKNLTLIASACAVLFIGTLIWHFQSPRPSAPANAPQIGSQNFRGTNGGPPSGGAFLGGDVKSFFKSDGSVDTERVNQILNNAPAEFKDRLKDRMKTQINEALSRSEITSDQAQKLRAAFGINS
jgi:hypothetical protein